MVYAFTVSYWTLSLFFHFFSMEMTHYMELLATNQPWNLILFMAIPVVLAETVAITELYILLTRNKSGTIGTLSKLAGITGWLYFIGVFFYLLFTAAIPITMTNSWRGIGDVIAVGCYLLGVIPLVGIALTDMKLYGKTEEERTRLHATFVGVFLVVAHIAMIFGMLNPSVLWYHGETSPTDTGEMNHMNM